MSNTSLKIPLLRSGEPYDVWKTKIALWQRCTNLAAEARAPAVALTLEGAASAAVIKIPIGDLASETGMDNVLTTLDGLFQEDKDQLTYSIYDTFEKFRRTESMSMSEYLVKFECLYQKAKQYNNILTEPVLAYRLLKGANLSEDKQSLARATCSEWKYETLKLQLKKIFDHSTTDIGTSYLDEGAVGGTTTQFSEMQIKSEPANFITSEVDEERNLFSRGGRSNYRRNYNDRNYNDREVYKPREKLNPIVSGTRLKCIACKSIYHLIRDCQHKNSYRGSSQNTNWRNTEGTYVVENEDEEIEEVYIQLFTSSMMNSKETDKALTQCYITSLVGECLGKCILDCGCNCNVAGKGWSDAYISSLEEKDRKRITESASSTKFKFGDGKIYKATKKINVPAELGNQKVMIEYHEINADLPLLLSKTGMQDAGCIIDFQKENVIMFGKKIDLSFTSSGHYTIPLTPKVRAASSDKTKIFFSTKDLTDKTYDEKEKMMNKIHKTFGHPSEIRLKKLIKDGGITDNEVMKAIENINKKCETCIRYKKPPLKPIACRSIAKIFNEVVTLDLFFYNGVPVIHLCDAATRFSRASIISSKKKEIVISAICILWISIFGPPQKILSDNGGEFSSHDFREMGDKLNTEVMSTAAESPWSNGINERHHAIITNMLDRILEENKLPLQVAISWACAAKNALANVYGFSPNQLLFGANPNYPSTLTSELPALETSSDSETILNNIKARTAAREAFIKAESCEKLKRALKSQTRTATSLEYQTGEEVFYKRNNIERWQGPARVIGIDGKNIILRHQSSVISVSPCRITHRVNESGSNKTEEIPIQRYDEKTNLEEPNNSTDSDDESGMVNRQEVEIQNVQNALPSQSIVDVVVEEVNEETAKRRGRPPGSKKQKEAVELPPTNSEIKYKIIGENEWRVAKVLGKAGKSTGGNRYCMNLYETENDVEKCIDFQTMVEQWERADEQEEVLFGTILQLETVKDAKKEEIKKWQDHNVYECVPDEGQRATSVRWVITKKQENTKARLVARGYEEECFQELRKDSPTIRKSVFRLAVAVITSNEWKINSLDIQSAFLQGLPVDRNILLKPPPEAENPNQLWKLKKAVYGLGDGGRNWYLKAESEIMNLGAKKSKYDTAMFMWYEGVELIGIIVAHVDDFLWGGNQKFTEETIQQLKTKFKISKEENNKFKYLGLEVRQKENLVEISQIAYVNELQPIEFDKKKGKDEKLSTTEERDLRAYIGQLQWLSSQTRPDLSFDACEASVEFSSATINTIHKANKVIRKMKNHDVKLKLPNLGDLTKCKIVTYSDASLNNLPRGGSQIGYIIFLSNGETVAPIIWKSGKAKRVVRSTLAVECLALSEGAGTSYYLRQVLADILNIETKTIPISCLVDNRNLYDSVHSTRTIADHRIYADISEIRDKLEQEEINTVSWVPAESQVANILTKSGASAESLLKILETSVL